MRPLLFIITILIISTPAFATGIKQSVAEYVSRNISLPPETTYEISFHTIPSKKKEHQTYSIIPSTPDLLRAKSFTVIGKSANRAENRYTVRANIKVAGKVAVATHDLYRGDEVTESDYEYQIRELRDLDNYYFVNTSPEGVVARTIRTGTPLKTNQIEPPKIILKGQSVTAIVEIGSLQLSTKAIAMKDGGLNDFIKLKNVDTKQLFYGQVVSDGTIKVSP